MKIRKLFYKKKSSDIAKDRLKILLRRKPKNAFEKSKVS